MEKGRNEKISLQGEASCEQGRRRTFGGAGECSRQPCGDTGETVVKRHTCSRDAGNRRPIRVPSREASVAERSVKRSVSTSLTGKP